MKTPLLKSNLIKPSIVRVGCSAFLVLAAAVLTAASLLSPSTGAAADPTYLMPAASSLRTVPVKTVNIKNNSGKPIYVVLEAAKQDIKDDNGRPHDRWLQAEFNDEIGTYASNYIYRAYVNPHNGIPGAGGSVSVTLPFYTQLQSPSGSKDDQYIDWWRALRIYVYDDPGAIQHAYDTDTNPANAVKISQFAPGASPVPTSGGAMLVVYRSQTGGDEHGLALPLNDPSQLLEFTFAKVNTRGPLEMPDHQFVDYDISSVDQVYLSVAMDPVNNPLIGYIGSVLGQKKFSDTLTTFRDEFNWPKYKWPDYVTNQNNIRLPATYNVMNQIAHPGDLDPTGPAIKNLRAIKKMEELWDGCCGAGWPESGHCKHSSSSDACNNMAKVAELFEKNYKKYRELAQGKGCQTPVAPNRDDMMAKMYGWVPFNSCKDAGDVNHNLNNELQDTPDIGGKTGYQEISEDYVDLQYHSPPNPKTFGVFNRFTELIHSKTYLHANEYGFSIDDAAGNMLEIGDGINITVGGAPGLDNTNPYDPWRFFLFNVGAAEETGPKWTKYRVCTGGTEEQLRACADKAPDRDMKGTRVENKKTNEVSIQYPAIKIGAVPGPFVIVLQDSNGALYKARVERLPEPPPTHPLNEVGDPPTAIDNLWNQKKEDGSYTNVKCFDNETSFDWCGGLTAYSAIERTRKGPLRTVYHVNTRRPEVFKPGIRFDNGPLEGTLSPDRLKVTVKWPKAIIQSRDNPPPKVKYELTLWDLPNCPDNGPCNGHAHGPPLPPTPGACDQSQTECVVTLSKLAPPLTWDKLKSISVTACFSPAGTPCETKRANFTAPPPNLAAIRENVHEEIDRIRDRLHQLEKQNSETKQSDRKSRWLEMRISVLTARLQYPTDEVLRQLEQEVEARQSLGREAWRSFLDQLNTRIVELQNGG